MPKSPSSPTIPLSTIRDVFASWAALYSPRAVLDDKRITLIRKALTTHGEDLVREAILGCQYSDFHMGRNDRGKKYTSLELILRDAKHIEQFAGYYADRPEEHIDLDALRNEGGAW